jgi:hypothetical protein
MIILGLRIDDYVSGYFGSVILAQEYINMPEQAPKDMPNGRYGLEEYFELRIATAKICGVSIKEAFAARPQHMKGMWDGFVNFTKAFRYFIEFSEQMKKEQERHNDISEADWWKNGQKKPWEKEQ